MLDLVRENRAQVQDMAGACRQILQDASADLKILDPELGEKELIKSWEVELARLRRG